MQDHKDYDIIVKDEEDGEHKMKVYIPDDVFEDRELEHLLDQLQEDEDTAALVLKVMKSGRHERVVMKYNNHEHLTLSKGDYGLVVERDQ